jgi:hypothetical protein
MTNPAEIIAMALNSSAVPGVWIMAHAGTDEAGAPVVIVTIDPDVGYTATYSLTPKEV